MTRKRSTGEFTGHTVHGWNVIARHEVHRMQRWTCLVDVQSSKTEAIVRLEAFGDSPSQAWDRICQLALTSLRKDGVATEEVLKYIAEVSPPVEEVVDQATEPKNKKAKPPRRKPRIARH